MSEDLQAVVERLENVEKSNRRLMRLGVTAVSIALLSLVLPPAIWTVCKAANIYPRLAVSGVVVYDEDGTQRGYFGYLSSPLDAEEDSGSPSLTLSYPSGSPGITLSVTESLSAIGVHNEDLSVDASLVLFDGTAPRLYLKKDKSVVFLGNTDEDVMLSRTNFATGQSARLHFASEPPSLVLSDNEKNPLWSAP